MRGAILVATALLGGCAATYADDRSSDAAELAQALAGRTAGTPQRCIDPTTASGPRIIGEALLYTEGRRLWVSEAVGGCSSLRGDPIPVIEVHGSRVCEGDRFRTIQRGSIGIPGPYCRVGPFIPYRPAAD